MPLYFQESFGAGELGPKLHRRFRLKKFQVGLAKARNVFIEPEGCVSKRAGTIFVADVGTADARLIPFKHSADEQYMLVLENLSMRIVKTGQLGFLQSSGDYTVVTPYATAVLRDIQFVQRDDVMYMLHPLVTVRKLSRTGDTSWTLTAVTFLPGIDAPTSPSSTYTGGGAGEVAAQGLRVQGDLDLGRGRGKPANRLVPGWRRHRLAGAQRSIVDGGA